MKIFKNIKYKINPRSIKFKIFIYFLLVTLICFTLVYIIVYKSYHSTIVKQTMISSSNILETTELKLTLYANDIYSLTKSIYSDSNLNYSIENYIETNNKKYISDITNILEGYIKSNNQIKSIRMYINEKPVIVENNRQKLINESFLGSYWHKKTIEGNGKLICIPTYVQSYEFKVDANKDLKIINNENIISFSRLIKNDKNEKIAILLVDYEENILTSIYDNVKLSKNHVNMICDDNGQIISSSYKWLIGENIFKKEYAQKPLKDMFVYNIANRDYIVTTRHFSILNWDVLAFTPIDEILLNKSTFNSTIYGFLLILIVANILLGILMTSIITKPIKNLLMAIKDVKHGNFYSRIKIKYKDEIGEVGLKFNEMVDSIQTLLRENYTVKLREKEAQIKSLQAQINPHFLYNTLDTITWKVLLLGGKDISKIINCLGKILRYSIKGSNEIVQLQNEIDQIKNYLYIQQTRYEDRFKAYFKLDEETLKLKINKLLIQPLVENAIQHGLEEKESNGVLVISSKIINDNLVVQIFDNGKGIAEKTIRQFLHNKQTSHKANHIGIINVDQRIKHYYGQDYGLSIKSKIDCFTSIELNMPIIK